jgi:hypothetical protein
MVTGRTAGRIQIAAIAAAWSAVTILATSSSVVPAVAQAPAGGALSEAQDVNGAPGLVAEIVQCKRENDTLSIRLRLRNTGADDLKDWRLVSGNIDQFYVVSGSKKYFVLRDSEKTPLATAFTGGYGTVDISISKGGTYMDHGKDPGEILTHRHVQLTR